MERTGTIYVPNTEVKATVQSYAILRDSRYLVSLSKSKKNKSILILKNLTIPVEFVHAPDATDDDYSAEYNTQDDEYNARVYYVKGGVVKQKIFAALTDAIKEHNKMLHVTAAVVDIAKDKANSAQQMNIAKEFEENASFPCGKTHNSVIVPVTLKGSTSSSLGGSMFNTVIATIKNMIPKIPVSQYPPSIRLKRSREGSSSSSSGGGGNDDGNGIGNNSAPGSPPAVPFLPDGKRIRFDDGAEACIECGVDISPPRVGTVRARNAIGGDENQDGNAKRPHLDVG
ncbi:hypothetical protein B484DRAFT_395512 [Ochromonadaceae sp. CCMP2298]|nr:hypothetical protein B484DRAFT_395512 [Ochromonadaceae sp. CCMP2298]